MKVKRIKAFNDVMITGSVSEAVRNLHRSQPSVSALIASLEHELGFSLFVRQKGRRYPVPEANYLHEECREVLTRIERIDPTMKQIRSQNSGELRIVAMPGPSPTVTGTGNGMRARCRWPGAESTPVLVFQAWLSL